MLYTVFVDPITAKRVFNIPCLSGRIVHAFKDDDCDPVVFIDAIDHHAIAMTTNDSWAISHGANDTVCFTDADGCTVVLNSVTMEFNDRKFVLGGSSPRLSDIVTDVRTSSYLIGSNSKDMVNMISDLWIFSKSIREAEFREILKKYEYPDPPAYFSAINEPHISCIRYEPNGSKLWLNNYR